MKPRPTELGGGGFTPLADAPGTYVFDELRRERWPLRRSHLGAALGTDYFRIREQLTANELATLAAHPRLRRRRGPAGHQRLLGAREFPWPLVEKLAELGLVGDGIVGYGCPGHEPARRRTDLHGAQPRRRQPRYLPRRPVRAGDEIHRLLGSEEQKQRWLPALARLEKIGAFGLTEPAHGSDSVALETTARRDGDDWVLDGAKRWIGNGTIADVVVVWARTDADGQVKGFLVEKDMPGFEPATIEGKGSLRARSGRPTSASTASAFPRRSRLPGARTFKDAGRVLVTDADAVRMDALGHAVAAYDAALTYSKQRTQFGKPLPASRSSSSGSSGCWPR